MKKHVIGVYNGTDFIQAIPYVYDGEKWVYAAPKVYQTEWLDIGSAGSLFFNFLENTGEKILDNGNNNVLIRANEEHDNWVSSDNKIMHSKSKTGTGAVDMNFLLVPFDKRHAILQDSGSNNLKDSNGLQLVVNK